MSGDLSGLAEPALVLTPPREPTPEDDGLLNRIEDRHVKVNADWVVLSACNTAASDGSPDAGGLSGLTKFFLCRCTLCIGLELVTTAAVRPVTAAFGKLGKEPDIGRAEALRQAEIAMLDTSNPSSHPLFWAPFVLAGEGSAGR